MIKESDIYRQNAENCMQMAEAAQVNRPKTGLKECNANRSGVPAPIGALSY